MSTELSGTEARTSRAVVCGFLAGVVMVVVFMGAYGALRLLTASNADHGLLMTWTYNLVHNSLLDAAGASLYAAFEIHTAVALVFSVCYVYLLEPRLAGSGMRRGAIASLIPWLLSICVFLPLAGFGMLGLEMGAGPLPVMGNLILHLAFGTSLGVMYEASAPAQAAASNKADASPVALYVSAARGLCVGGALALVVVLAAPPSAPVIAYAGTLLASVLGLLVGVFSSLPQTAAGAR